MGSPDNQPAARLFAGWDDSSGRTCLIAADGQEYSHARIAALGVTPVVKDLAEISDMKRDLWQKQDSIRHDPDAVAETLMSLLLARR